MNANEDAGNSADVEDTKKVIQAEVFDNNQQDKVTLKLFCSVVESRKVEWGFDLVQRLHSEQCYSISIQMADCIGLHKLSNHIKEVTLQKFPPLKDEEDVLNDSASFESSMCSDRSTSFDDYEPVVTTR